MSITIHESQEKIQEFLQHHTVGVLATANDKAVPHAATVYFVTDDDLNFYFVTKEKTAKYKNLHENPHASLAVFDAKLQTTLQVDGTAKVIEDISQFMELFTKILHISVNTSDSSRPPISKLYAGDYYMFRLKPHQVRLAEYMKPDHGDFGNIFEVIKP